MGPASVNLMQLASTAVMLCEITRNEGHRAVQGHPRSPILVLIKVKHPRVTSCEWTILTYVLSCTILRVIAAYSSNYHLCRLTPVVGVNFRSLDCKTRPRY